MFFDNYYNYVTPAAYSAKRSTYVSGTLRSDRKDKPHAVTKAKLKKGEFVLASKWKI